MKNKLKSLLAVFLSAILCLSAISLFVACGEDGEETTNPVVYSNGGTVVVYNNDVYFVNGVPDYTDESGQTNLTGSVVKGGLYKTTVTDYRMSLAEQELAEAEKEAAETGGEPVIDNKADGLYDVMDFKNFEKLDYKELGAYTIGSESEAPRYTENGREYQNFVSTNGERSEYRIVSEQVVSKKIGTAGYADGGFWIFDGIIYFATPDTDRNSEGAVQYQRAEFYSYNLETGSMTLLYTARESNTAMPYAFFKRGDSVYLVTYENYFANAEDETNNIMTGFIVSTQITDGRPGETTEIASGVSSVYFPRTQTYDPADNPGNTVSDYIYYTRAAKSTDSPSSGTRLEMIRPDGQLPEVLNADGTVETPAYAGSKTITVSTVGTLSIEGVAGDYLYYRNPVTSGRTQLECTNLYAQLKEYDSAAAVPLMIANTNVVISDVSSYTTIIPIEQDRPDSSVSLLPVVLASSSNGVFRISPTVANVQIYNGTINLLGYNNGKAYGSLDTSTTDEETGETEAGYTTFVCFSSFRHYSDRTLQLLAGSIPTATFDIDFFSIGYNTKIGNKELTTEEFYTFYFSSYDATATDYAFINKVSGLYDSDGSTSVRLGQVADHDRPTIVCHDDQCINWTHDHSSWDDLTPDEEEEGEMVM